MGNRAEEALTGDDVYLNIFAAGPYRFRNPNDPAIRRSVPFEARRADFGSYEGATAKHHARIALFVDARYYIVDVATEGNLGRMLPYINRTLRGLVDHRHRRG